MMFLKREEVIKRYSNIKWISPYDSIFAMSDGEYIEVHEFHARGKCIGGSAWEIYHYPRVSNLIIEAKREGARNIFILKTGKTNLNLIPGIAGAGIEEVLLRDDREIEITYAGLAGGGIAATICRGMAHGVIGIEIIQEGGGEKLGKAKLILERYEKLVIGIDDTDSSEKGATWALANEIGYEVERKGLGYYLMHVITQLYPKNPYKTTNCVSISLTFATKNPDEVVRFVKKELKEKTFSEETGMAVYSKITIPNKLKDFAKKAKNGIVEIDEAIEVAKDSDIKLIKITGERGFIGAVASIAYSNNPDEGVRI